MRRLAAGLALLVLTACGGDPPDPVASGSPTPTATATRKPKPKPKPSRTPTPTPTPTAVPVTGDPIGTAEALLALSTSAEVRSGNDCRALVPDMTEPACAAVKTAGGTLVAATGRVGSRKAIRLLVPVDGGYAVRYEGRDPSRSWRLTKAYAAPLTGTGNDGVVFEVRLTDGGLTYDVLTWVAGGPLVLRAHRGPLADGRLAPAQGGLAEYELAVDGSYVRRRVAWDGRRFRLSAGTRATSAPPR